jgi:predicted CopG family antitoxin
VAVGTKHVRLDEEFYEWVKSQSRGSETISETLERLTRRSDLLDIPEILDEGGLEDAKQAARGVRERKDRKAAAREAFRE